MARTRDEGSGTTHGVRAADRGLAIERRFTHAGRAPVRRDRVGGPRRASSATPPSRPSSSATSSSRRAGPRTRPTSSRRSTSAARWASPAARALRQADGRPRGRHDRRAGAARATTSPRAEDAEAFEAELTPHPGEPARGLQLAGLVQRRLRGEPAVLGLLHPLRRGHDGVDPRLEHQGGHDLPRRLRVRASTSRRSAPPRSSSRRAASPPGRCRSCAAPTPGPARSSRGGKTRRAAKMVVLDVDHPDIRDFIWCKAREEDKAEALARGRLRHVDRRRGLPLDPVPEREQLGARDRRLHATRSSAARSGRRPRASPASRSTPTTPRELMGEIAEAAWRCADPGVQYDTTINDWHTCPNTGRINASNPCSEYMHVDDSACNLASINLLKFLREDGTFDVGRLRAHRRHRVPRPGDPRRLLELPDRGDHGATRARCASSASATRTSARC